jgi:hypothetical protein
MTHHGPFRVSIAVAVGWGLRISRGCSARIERASRSSWCCSRSGCSSSRASGAADHLRLGRTPCGVHPRGDPVHKALAGVGWRAPEFERPLGAFVAFFVQIHSTHFAWRLINDASFLDWYREGKAAR